MILEPGQTIQTSTTYKITKPNNSKMSFMCIQHIFISK